MNFDRPYFEPGLATVLRYPSAYVAPHFIDRPIACSRYTRKSPFPDTPSAYAAYLSGLGAKTLLSLTVPFRESPSHAPAEFSQFAFFGSDMISFTPCFREKKEGSVAVVDNFTVESSRFGTFHLTHFRFPDSIPQCVCTIRRDITSWTAFRPRVRHDSPSFVVPSGRVYTEWEWEEVYIQPRRFGSREEMELTRPIIPAPLDDRVFWGKKSGMGQDLDKFQV